MKTIEVISKVHHQVMSQSLKNIANVNEDVVIVLGMDLNHIQDVWRQNQDAVVEYKQQKIVIEDFFSQPYSHDLILKDHNEGLFLAHFFDKNNQVSSEIKLAKVSSYMSLLYSDLHDLNTNVDVQKSNQEIQQQTQLQTSKAIAAVGTGLNEYEKNLWALDETDSMYRLLTDADTQNTESNQDILKLENISLDELLLDDTAMNISQINSVEDSVQTASENTPYLTDRHDPMIDLLLKADTYI